MRLKWEVVFVVVSELVSSPERVQTFVEGLQGLVKKFGIDGINLDWCVPAVLKLMGWGSDS
jgi:GH18 family chitinase